MKSNLFEEFKISEIKNEILKQEIILQQPEPGTTRNDFEKLIAEEFREIGASGRSYGRQEVIEALIKRSENPASEKWEIKDADCIEISPGSFLFTYLLIQSSRTTHRASIWRRRGADLQILYHQGTITQYF